MNDPSIRVTHTGRMTVVSVRASGEQVQRFREALLKAEFFLISAADSAMRFGRKTRLMRGDWPMEVRLAMDGDWVEIRWFMFVPWTWILSLAVMVFLFLPFIGFQSAQLTFLPAVCVIALAVYKQKLDLSPDASWQGPPRAEWNKRMSRLIAEVFGEKTG